MTDCASVIACACPTLDDADDFDLTRETRVRIIVSTRPPSPATDLRDRSTSGRSTCVFRSCDYVRLSIVLLPDAMRVRDADPRPRVEIASRCTLRPPRRSSSFARFWSFRGAANITRSNVRPSLSFARRKKKKREKKKTEIRTWIIYEAVELMRYAVAASRSVRRSPLAIATRRSAPRRDK